MGDLELAKGYAERAYDYFIQNHTFEIYLDCITQRINSLSSLEAPRGVP